MSAVLTAQLRALRATLAAAVQQVDAMLAGATAGLPCEHPAEKRRDMSTMGEPRFECRVCGTLVEGKAA